MGRPKLLLPFGDTTVIGQLISTLEDAEIPTFVLIRPDDPDLYGEVAKAQAVIVQPADSPSEMRVSIEHLLREIASTQRPTPDDGWLLIPADSPLLSHRVLQQLVDSWQHLDEMILVPTHQGKRGHPTLFAWQFAEEVFRLPRNVGVNQLIHDHPAAVNEVPVEDPTIHLDLDTPDDYKQALSLMDG